MLPGPLLLFDLRDGDVRPRYLTRVDEPWLRGLIDLYDRNVGRRRRELDDDLAESEPAGRGRRAYRAAAHVLGRLHGVSEDAATRPREARRELFGAACGRPLERDRLLAEVAARLELEPEALLAALFADLPAERRLRDLDEPISPAELALRCNLANVQGLLYRSTEVRLALEGNSRRVVHYSKLRGLICSVAQREDLQPRSSSTEPLTLVRLSGPLSLFRRTLLYGRALSGLVPQLAWCRRYRLRANCVLPFGEGVLRLQSGDPVMPAVEPARFDSKLEERFARDFGRAAPRWELIREPEPFDAGGALVYPDFLLASRDDPRRRWYLEIAGFWTAEYLDRKLARYRRAKLSNLILAIDADRRCSEADFPTGAEVIRYRRRVKAEDVLAVIEGGQERPLGMVARTGC